MNLHSTKILAVIVLLLGISGHTRAETTTEARIRDYFFDVPVMISIAKCESTFTQYTANGETFYDATHTYIGAFQIAEQIHSNAAKALGFDIATLEGNIGYARHLYNREGTNPWKGCVPKETGPVPTPPSTSMITMNFNLGMVHIEILSVQKLLNTLGFTLSDSGPGSPGNETMKFGALTRKSVQQFQCSKNIVCEGDEWSTGYGRIGPRTRAALNLAASQK